MHAIYTVKAVDQRKKRSILYSYHTMVHHPSSRVRRAALSNTIGESFNRGTQITRVKLEKRNKRSSSPLSPNESGDLSPPNKSGFPIVYILAAAGSVVLLVSIIFAVVLVRRRRDNKTPPSDNKGSYTGGKHIVVRQKSKGGTKTSAAPKRSSSGYNSCETSEV